LAPAAFRDQLRGEGLGVRFGPFEVRLRSDVEEILDDLRQLYRDYPLLQGPRVFSAHVELRAARRGPRLVRNVRVLVDGRPPHEDMPRAHALAVLEWAINLVIAARHAAYLMLHAAVLERDGRAVLLPAAPGSGKTTLCAALSSRGWRLLSDEIGLLRPGTLDVLPVPRLLPLKNESIAVLREYAPDAFLGPAIPGTRKGTIAHLRPPADAVHRADEPARARWVVFPRWQRGAALRLAPVAKGPAFIELATHAFNYEALGLPAFETVRDLVAEAECFYLEYSRLDDAVSALDRCSRGLPP
jgi:HprK-related kinase A